MNNKVFMVCVEINTQALRNRFENMIIGNDRPKKIMENVYVCITPYSYTSDQIRNTVNSVFQDDCNVFVMKASVDASWRLDLATDSWLRSNI